MSHCQCVDSEERRDVTALNAAAVTRGESGGFADDEDSSRSARWERVLCSALGKERVKGKGR